MVDVLFQRYEITDDCLEKLSVDQRAMFAVLCLTLSEVEAMRKVLTLGPSTPVGDEDLDAALLSQRTVFMRLIGMKILEVFKTLTLSKRQNKSEDRGLIEFCRDCVLSEFEELKAHPSHSFVTGQRNQLGFHYDLSMFRELVKRQGVTAEHSVLVAEPFEFKSCPYGEIAVVSGLGGTATEYSQADAKKSLEALMEFTTEAMGRFSTVFTLFFQKFLAPHLTLSEVRKTVPNSLVVKRGEAPFPLFVDREISQ